MIYELKTYVGQTYSITLDATSGDYRLICRRDGEEIKLLDLVPGQQTFVAPKGKNVILADDDSNGRIIVTPVRHNTSLVPLSAYDIAIRHGFVGSEEQWLASLKGEKGETGSGWKTGDIKISYDLTDENLEGFLLIDYSWWNIIDFDRLYAWAEGKAFCEVSSDGKSFRINPFHVAGEQGGYFPRAANADRPSGNVQQDAQQAIDGYVGGMLSLANPPSTGGAFWYKDQTAASHGGSNAVSAMTVMLDSSKCPGVRTAGENRPKNIAVWYLIKY